MRKIEGEKNAPSIGQPRLLRMSDVKAEPIRWLWKGRVALGKLTLFAGDPGLGKSLLTIDIAARVSNGLPWPDGTASLGIGGVVMLSAEDDPADTIRPRLDAVAADVSKIALLQAVEWYDGEKCERTTRTFSLERDIAALDEAVTRTADCRLVVIDPISAYCGRADSHKNSDVRGLLAPLAELAQRHRVAVVGVTHLNKGGGPAMYRPMGSLAFVAAARAAWAVVKDPDDPTNRLMLPVKCNLAADTSGLAYKVMQAENGAPCLSWSPDPVEIRVDDVLAADTEKDGRGAERRKAEAWLRQVLADGRVASKDVQRQAKEAGHAWATVRRAKVAIGVEDCREGFGKGAIWYWQLPHRCSQDSIGAHFPEVSNNGRSEHLWCEQGGMGADPDADEINAELAQLAAGEELP